MKHGSENMILVQIETQFLVRRSQPNLQKFAQKSAYIDINRSQSGEFYLFFAQHFAHHPSLSRRLDTLTSEFSSFHPITLGEFPKVDF